MIKVYDIGSDGIGFELSGVVSGEDYEKILIPAIKKKLQTTQKLNVLYHVTSDFDSYELQAIFDDAKAGFEFLGQWNKIAVVSDINWIINSVKLFAFMMPGSIKTYTNAQLEDAKKWLLEEDVPHPNLHITLDATDNIVTLEPKTPLSKDDFLYAKSVIDPFLQQHGDLKGLIIYTKEFPGWDSFAGFITHMEFIKEHHKHVKKLAFVTDSYVGEMAQKLGSHFVSAEVKNFDYNELEKAKGWIVS